MAFRLTRRTLLCGGAATALALPRLEGMFGSSTAFAQELAAPRFVAFYVPNGVIEEQWFPSGGGDEPRLEGTALEPLSAHRDHLTILRKLGSPGRRGSGNAHMRAIAGFLTGAAIENDRVSRHRISIDQFIADHYAEVAPTRIHSLQLAGNNELDPPNNSSYNNLLKNSLSFDWEGRILPNTSNLQAVFDRLFEGADVQASDREARRRRLMRTSVLDSVQEDRERLVRHLGSADRERVDEYFESVRAIEQRLADDGAELGGTCMPGARDNFPAYADGPRLHAIGEHARQTAELVRLAFACDLTRSVTYMAGGEAAGCSYRDIDINQHFHNSISHNRAGKADLHHRIDTFHSELVAAFLDGLQGTDEGGASLLDRTVLVYGSGLGNGDQHNLNDVAFCIASRLGRFANGQYLSNLNARSSGDALLTVLEEMGLPQASFGDSDRAISL